MYVHTRGDCTPFLKNMKAAAIGQFEELIFVNKKNKIKSFHLDEKNTFSKLTLSKLGFLLKQGFVSPSLPTFVPQTRFIL